MYAGLAFITAPVWLPTVFLAGWMPVRICWWIIERFTKECD